MSFWKRPKSSSTEPATARAFNLGTSEKAVNSDIAQVEATLSQPNGHTARPADTLPNPALPCCVVSKGRTVSGNFAYRRAIRIEGFLKGDLYSSGAVHVGKDAVIDGKIEAHTIIVEGKILRGPVRVHTTLEVRNGAAVDGKVIASKLRVSSGGVVNGSLDIR